MVWETDQPKDRARFLQGLEDLGAPCKYDYGNPS